MILTISKRQLHKSTPTDRILAGDTAHRGTHLIGGGDIGVGGARGDDLRADGVDGVEFIRHEGFEAIAEWLGGRVRIA
jgi:hypothetical protein